MLGAANGLITVFIAEQGQIYIYTHIYIYIYIYIHTHIYIYIYTHTHIHTRNLQCYSMYSIQLQWPFFSLCVSVPLFLSAFPFSFITSFVSQADFIFYSTFLAVLFCFLLGSFSQFFSNPPFFSFCSFLPCFHSFFFASLSFVALNIICLYFFCIHSCPSCSELGITS